MTQLELNEIQIAFKCIKRVFLDVNAGEDPETALERLSNCIIKALNWVIGE